MYSHTDPVDVGAGFWSARILSPVASETPCSIVRRGKKADVVAYLKKSVRRMNLEHFGRERPAQTKQRHPGDAGDRPSTEDIRTAAKTLGIHPNTIVSRVTCGGWTWARAMSTAKLGAKASGWSRQQVTINRGAA